MTVGKHHWKSKHGRLYRTRRLGLEHLEPRAMLAATVADWTGLNNASAPNNYGLISPIAAGGTFDERSTSGAYFSDPTLVGGAFDFNNSLSITGEIAFTSPVSVDPNWFFGFYNSAGTTFANTHRIGIALGDVSGGGFFRMQFNANNAATNTNATADTNGAAAGGNNQFPVGTSIPFSLTYNGTAKAWSVSFGPSGGVTVTNSGTLAAAFGTPNDVLNRFGFWQVADATAGQNDTFTYSVTNLNYTGETAYSAAMPGDYSNNGNVDGADYVVWRKAPPTAVLPNDITPSGVGPEDYTAWRTNYGNTIPTPTAPTNLVATPGASQISLTWADNASSETGFAIERRIGTSGAFTQIATVGVNATSYVNTGLMAQKTYEYQVRALNGAGSSAPSNTASATTPQVTIVGTNFTRTQIYHSPNTPGWTSWVGTWLMPDGSIMVGLTQATGPVQPWHINRDYSGLDIDVVYLRSWDGGTNWTKIVESDVSFTTSDTSGKGTHANNASTTLLLNDGSLIRRVYGWDYGEFPDMPGTGFVQRSTDGGLTWSDQPHSTNGGLTWSNPSPVAEFFLDPLQYTVQPTRLQRLTDGRILMIGSVWNGPNTQSAPHEPLLMISSDEAVTWTRIQFAGPGWNASYLSKFNNEWDLAELPNGDLILNSRVQNQNRWQAIFAKNGSSFQITSAGEVPIPHSGHPELLATQEGPIVYFATTGAMWTNNNGQTWNTLPMNGGSYLSRYYPNSLQTPDGWIYVFGHNGFDNYYGEVDQYVWMDKFRLMTTAVPGAGAGGENFGSIKSSSSQSNALFVETQPLQTLGPAATRPTSSPILSKPKDQSLLNVVPSNSNMRQNSSLTERAHRAAVDESMSGDDNWFDEFDVSSEVMELLRIADQGVLASL